MRSMSHRERCNRGPTDEYFNGVAGTTLSISYATRSEVFEAGLKRSFTNTPFFAGMGDAPFDFAQAGYSPGARHERQRGGALRWIRAGLRPQSGPRHDRGYDSLGPKSSVITSGKDFHDIFLGLFGTYEQQ